MHHLAHLTDLRWIEAIGGLVQDEKIRKPEHRLRDPESLLMPWL